MPLSSSRVEATLHGQTIAVEGETGISNRYVLFVDDEQQDEVTHFTGVNHLQGTAGDVPFRVRLQQKVKIHFYLEVDGEEREMGSDFIL